MRPEAGHVQVAIGTEAGSDLRTDESGGARRHRIAEEISIPVELLDVVGQESSDIRGAVGAEVDRERVRPGGKRGEAVDEFQRVRAIAVDAVAQLGDNVDQSIGTDADRLRTRETGSAVEVLDVGAAAGIVDMDGTEETADQQPVRAGRGLDTPAEGGVQDHAKDSHGFHRTLSFDRPAASIVWWNGRRRAAKPPKYLQLR